jgi:tryptophan synthase alpha subunit
VGSAIVSVIGEHKGAGAVTKVTELCRALADSIHAAANDRVGA